MAEQHASNHGNTPAAWTTVVLLMVAFTVACVGVLLLSPPVFIAGVVLTVVALIVGKVMSMMGYGKQAAHARAEQVDAGDRAG
jgi:Family of unknown function (DUF6704)